MRTVLVADHILTPEPAADGLALVIEDGVISGFAERGDLALGSRDQLLQFDGCTALPAFLDVHVHGAAGFDVMEASPTALDAVSRFLASRGVGAFLATTVTAPVDVTLASLSRLASRIRKTGETEGAGARPVGIHLEGPFLSHSKRGVHPPEDLQPASVDLFERMWQAAEGQIRLMTIAPELANACELIAHATALGVRVSLGHSDATAAEARCGIAAGATSATHTFNAMRALHHREPGIAGVVLDEGSLYAELICDGLHVAPELVRLFWKAKGAGRAILVTDAMSATGMRDGVYKLGGLDVEVSGGVCMLDGALAGSTLTMDGAVRNFAAYTGAPLSEAGGLAGRNPARMIGVADRIGTLAPGRSADIVILSAAGEVVATLLRGGVVFRA